MPEKLLFVSDCHLDRNRPEVSAVFVEFLDKHARRADQLYILGDLFEVWLGDDQPVDELQTVIDKLHQLADSTEIFFLHGNRDFLIGEGFANRARLKLLNEPHQLQLGGQRVALVHGDSLCTDDHDYQAFREIVRKPEWIAEFLAKPLTERTQIATQLRSDSIAAMAQKSEQIMDVNPQAVADFFEINDVRTIIHGHTHRPGVHRYADERTRYVMGDWNPTASYLSWSKTHGFNLIDSRLS